MKHNVMKRTLAGVLAVLCVASYLPANVGTGGFIGGTSIVASADGDFTNVSTAADLKANLEAGKSCKLTGDITLSQKVTIAADKSVTLDLNGYTLSSGTLTGNIITVPSSSSLTVQDTSEDEDGQFSVGEKAVAIYLDGTVTLKSGTVYGGVAKQNNGYLIQDSRNAGSTAVLNIEGTAKVKLDVSDEDVNNSMISMAGTINVKENAVLESGAQALKSEEETTIINISGGTITSGLTSTQGPAVYGYGVTTISGGTINTVHGNGALLATTWGDLKSTTTITGDAVINGIVRVEQYTRASSQYKPDLVVNGGYVKGIRLGADDKAADAGSVTINGGTVEAVYDTTESTFDLLTINGGSIGSIDITETNKLFFGENVSVVEVTDEENNVTYATIGGIKNITKNGTYKLTSDSSVDNITIANGVEATIDLNGYSITTTANNTKTNPSHVFFNHGNLIINDSSTGATGTVNAKGSGAAAIFNDVGATCTVNNGNFNSENWYTVKNLGTMNIEDGTFTQGTKADETAIAPTSNASLIANGWYNAMSTTEAAIDGFVVHTGDTVASLTIDGGKFTHLSKTSCIKNDDYSSALINDGTFLSENGFLFQATGAGTIAGGSFTGFSSVAVYNADGSEKYEPGVLNITGGSFSASYIAREDNSYGSLSVSGGTFSSLTAALEVDSPNVSDTITGGSFNTELDAAYIAEGYYQDEDGDVVADERTDISNAKITVNYNGYGTSFPYHNGGTYNISNAVTVKVGETTLYEGDDFEIYEGTTEAEDVGTYAFKIRGKGNYKGTAVGNWIISNDVTVEVVGGERKVYSYGQAVTVNSGSTNGYWEAYYEGSSSAQIVSYSPTYSFVAQKNVELVWVEEEVAEEVEKSVLTMSASQTTYNNKNAINFIFNRSVDTKYTVKEVGIIYATNKLAGADTSIEGYKTANLSTNGEAFGVTDLAQALKTRTTVKKYVASYKNYNGRLGFSYALSADNIYANAIGYVVVYDPTKKETKTLYSNAVATNYTNANS